MFLTLYPSLFEKSIKYIKKKKKKEMYTALTSLAQWIEHWPADWPMEGVQEAADRYFSLINVSNSLILSVKKSIK